ncbi:hypothetical protein O3797_04530 [Gemella sanguinis]|jgi:hypothetical protein|uniref:Uncharacterized protein n=1 Tax=Gemella sanguinis TaxID=84135 RepID=A0A2N6SDZ7_9BACL|nr:hypothetical protein [Gemella sanguinis]EGF87005.1 hypothetical protein HMPREF0433_01223 [Gemella sanguinis M325]NKZ26120.1 hypothetical protein [Gemella sanguinis]PMC52136.1 hypothetical protein CJ218_05955 [Gemella sanguinis]QGS07637.1 hypothetical protein FOC50_04875 [Gemella sanguinis]
MDDKKLRFLAINMLVTVVALGIIIGAIFIDNQKTKMITMFTAIGILVVQKIVEIIMIKETRRISIVVLIIIVSAASYFGYRM